MSHKLREICAPKHLKLPLGTEWTINDHTKYSYVLILRTFQMYLLYPEANPFLVNSRFLQRM